MGSAIRLEWRRDSAGYEVYDYDARKPPITKEVHKKNGPTIELVSLRSGLYVKGCSGELESYVHTAQDGWIFPNFLNANTPEKAAEFTTQYGQPGLRWSNLHATKGSPDIEPGSWDKDVKEYPFEMFTHDQLSVNDILRRIRNATERYEPTSLEGLPEYVGGLTAQIDYVRHGAKPVLSFCPEDLLSYMRLEAAMVATGSQDVRQCAECGHVFVTGAGTDRRGQALYCSNACRQRAYVKRKNGSERKVKKKSQRKTTRKTRSK